MPAIPRSADAITEDWLKDAFMKGRPEARDVKVVSIERDTKSVGLMSATAKAVISAKMLNDQEETHNVFIKLMPQHEGCQQMLTGMNLDITEIESYKTFLTQLIEYEKTHFRDEAKLQSYLPLFYSGEYTRGEEASYYIMLENVCPEFKNIEIADGMSLEQTKAALGATARLHAVSFCFGKKQKVDFEAEYPFLCKSYTRDITENQDLSGYMDMSLKKISSDLEGTAYEEIRPKVDVLAASAQKTLRDLSTLGKGRFLIHGDSWANNLLFSSDNRVKLVDWQFTSTANVLSDYALTVYMSMTPEMIEEHEESMAAFYYQTFYNICQKFQMTSDVPWSEDEFKKETQSIGVLFSALIWALSYEAAAKSDSIKNRVFWSFRKASQVLPQYFTKQD